MSKSALRLSATANQEFDRPKSDLDGFLVRRLLFPSFELFRRSSVYDGVLLLDTKILYRRAMRTLLVVDDDRMQRQLLDDGLRSSGYTVLLACNGIEAIAIATKVKVDVILLDLNMPEMDGWQVAVHIKEFIDSRMPIIVISSYCLPGDRARAHAVGCVDLVRKPVELAQLYALIDDVLVDCETPFGFDR